MMAVSPDRRRCRLVRPHYDDNRRRLFGKLLEKGVNKPLTTLRWQRTALELVKIMQMCDTTLTEFWRKPCSLDMNLYNQQCKACFQALLLMAQVDHPLHNLKGMN